MTRPSWERVRTIPDQMFWSVRQYLKSQLLHMVRHRIREQHFRNQGSESHLDRLLRFADPDNPNVLTIGFGRRFATYKRAALLFNDLDALRRLLGDPQRPVVFIYSGKAHPADQPGQEFIRTIARMGRMPEFEGKILLVEGYDLHLARRLVSGVDVWLNNPVFPMEASGTSGMKAGMNGVINLSVLDGWWDEGYQGDNGWAIKPASSAARHRAARPRGCGTLYDILQDRTVPLYYGRGEGGFSQEWIAMAKRSMASLLPRFNTTRMVNEYVTKFYVPASAQGRRYNEKSFEGAKTVASWKARVRAAWPGVTARRVDNPRRRIQFGDTIPIEISRQPERARSRRRRRRAPARARAAGADALPVAAGARGRGRGRRHDRAALRSRLEARAVREAGLPSPLVPAPRAAHAPVRAGVDALDLAQVSGQRSSGSWRRPHGATLTAHCARAPREHIEQRADALVAGPVLQAAAACAASWDSALRSCRGC